MIRPSRRAVLALGVIVPLVSCGDTTAPAAGPPTRVVAVSGRVFGAEVEREAEAPLGVRVTDQHGRPVAGAVVSFGVTVGAGITLRPATTTTNADGLAEIRARGGTQAGEVEVTASVPGVAAPARFSGVVLPGPVARLSVTPRLLRLSAAGSSGLLRVDVQDRHGNVVPAGAVSFRAEDSTLFTVDAAGAVRALRAGGSARLVVTAGGKADTALVSVADPSLRPCAAAASVVAPPVGEVLELDAAHGVCVRAGEAGAQLVLIPFSNATSVFAQTPVETVDARDVDALAEWVAGAVGLPALTSATGATGATSATSATSATLHSRMTRARGTTGSAATAPMRPRLKAAGRE